MIRTQVFIRSILLLSICFLSLQGKAQKSKTYISAEAFGNGLTASLSFAKPLLTHPDYDIVFQWGIGWTPEYAESAYPINLPAQLYWKYGRKAISVELGIGSSIIFQSSVEDGINQSNEYYLSPVLGLRHEARKWFIRTFACPLFHMSGPVPQDDLGKQSAKVGISLGVVL